MRIYLPAKLALCLGLLLSITANSTIYNANDQASLKLAIDNANGSGTADTINLTANIVIDGTLGTFSADGANGMPSITTAQALLISGNGFAIERNTGGGPPTFRLLHIASSANVTIDGVIFRNGLAKNTVGDARGGGIYNLGRLIILDSVFEDNISSGINSFPLAPTGAPPTNAYGGAIYHGSGSLSITNTAFNRNQAEGGPPVPPLNKEDYAYGGAIYHESGSISIIDTAFSRNHTEGGPPVLAIDKGSDAYGGAIYATNPATIGTITGCTFDGNQANAGSGGGAVFGLGQGSGGSAFGGGIALSAVSLDTLTDTIFMDNQAKGGNSPVLSFNFFSAGHGYGGAIHQEDGVIEDISFSTFDRNRAMGGVLLQNGFAGIGAGGAISLQLGAEESAQITVLKNSTLSNNQATGVGTEFNHSRGGALAMAGAVIEINNSTLSGNLSDRFGGAIHMRQTSLAKLTANTITNNSVVDDFGGGGIYIEVGSTIESLISNIIAANSDGSTAEGQDIVDEDILQAGISAITSADFNLIGVAGVGSGNNIAGGNNITGTVLTPLDPLLDPLADNGGPTETHKLQVASLAINAGSNPVPKAVTDQRGPGFVREAPADEPDIGSFELQCSEQPGLCPPEETTTRRRRGDSGGSIWNYPWPLPLRPIELPPVIVEAEEVTVIVEPQRTEKPITLSLDEAPAAQGCSSTNNSSASLLFLLVLLTLNRVRRVHSAKAPYEAECA